VSWARALSAWGTSVLLLGRCAPPAPAPEPPRTEAPAPGPVVLAPEASAPVVAPLPVDASPPPREAAAPTAAAPVGDAAAPVESGPVCALPKKTRLLAVAPAAWSNCGNDAHCVLVSSACCSCGPLAADKARAVNRPTFHNGNPYCRPGTGCPACAAVPNAALDAVCSEGRCRARETIDPCAKPPGEPSLIEQMQQG